MKKYLHVKLPDRSFSFDINLLRSRHNQYLDELNDIYYPQNVPACWTSPAQEITDEMFENDDYILGWLTSYLSWHKFLDLLMISEVQWRESKKKILRIKTGDQF